MRMIDVVITMGGLGQRFRKFGYDIPKYMIIAKEKTLFEWSLLSLTGYSKMIKQFIFIVMKDDKIDVKDFINKKCELLRISNYQIIVIDYLTDGQATTAILAKKYWNEENALLVYNIDTYVEEGEMNAGQLKGDGFVPCFKAIGDHWSFVRADENGRAIEIKEKQRISDNCTLGAYYFSSCNLYEDLYREYYGKGENCVNGEKYIAPLYNLLLEKGKDVFISIVDSAKVHVLGTPEELSIFMNGNQT